MNNYVPLDVCSSYSTGDSICQVPRLVRKAREMGFPALALTDRNFMFGSAEFHAACHSRQIKFGGGFPDKRQLGFASHQADNRTIHRGDDE